MRVIHGGSQAFDSLIFGAPTRAEQQYFGNNVQSLMNMVASGGAMTSGFLQNMQEKLTNAYNSVFSDENMHLARAALNQVRGVFQRDIIRTIENISDMQIATPVMQRWIMACPTVRQRYHEQKCDGYSDSYIDLEPKAIGEEHYDYRRVMDGVYTDDGKGVYYRHYYEPLHSPEDELDHWSKVAILDTWDNITNLFVDGMKDPTSPWDDDL